MIKKVLTTSLILAISSCSFFNSKEIALPIKSNPAGASIYIDGKYSGQTPTNVNLIPDKNYKATISKEGYSSATINLESWASARGHRGGGDMYRCVADMTGIMLVIPIAGFMSVYCRDFKQEEYSVNLVGNANFQGAGYGAESNYNAAPASQEDEGYTPYDAYMNGPKPR